MSKAMCVAQHEQVSRAGSGWRGRDRDEPEHSVQGGADARVGRDRRDARRRRALARHQTRGRAHHERTGDRAPQEAAAARARAISLSSSRSPASFRVPAELQDTPQSGGRARGGGRQRLPGRPRPRLRVGPGHSSRCPQSRACGWEVRDAHEHWAYCEGAPFATIHFLTTIYIMLKVHINFYE